MSTMATRAWTGLVLLAVAAACGGESTRERPSGSPGPEANGDAGAAVGEAAGAAGSERAAGGTFTGGAPTGAGGSAATGGIPATGDAGAGGVLVDPDEVQCAADNPTFPEFDKSCSSVDECALVSHTTDCCGSQLRMAINQSEVERFDAAEAVCSAQYPACGCAAQGVSAEDGTLVSWSDVDSIVAECSQGRCQSRVAGDTYACGTATCTSAQYCTVVYGGTPESTPSYSCSPLGGCSDCDCLAVSAGCDCAVDQQGFIQVACYMP
jgi:hypothetical protein